MSGVIVVAVLGAALLHASWNALLKSGVDRFWWMTALCVVQGTLSAAIMLVTGLPPPESWPYAAASAVIHLIYQLLLVRTYAVGDFGQTYPIARGSSPVLVAAAAFAVAHEQLSADKIAGILLVSGGIMALAFEGRRFNLDRVPVALATGVSIAAYTIVDGIGGRISGTPISYIALMSVMWMGLTIPVFIFARGVKAAIPSERRAWSAVLGGAVALAGYAIVVWAMTKAPMGMVSALRETSVVFAALIGRMFLKERLTVGRLAACAVIAGGGALLG